jgi:hypothetical protein
VFAMPCQPNLFLLTFQYNSSFRNNRLFTIGGYVGVNETTEMIIDFASASGKMKESLENDPY